MHLKIHTCLIDYIKVFDYVQHQKLWSMIRDMEVSSNFVSIKFKVFDYVQQQKLWNIIRDEVSSTFDSIKTWFHKQQTAVRVAYQNDLGHED